ncbi:hypothetical protein Tco_0044059 [Tanacetum coccineum]
METTIVWGLSCVWDLLAQCPKRVVATIPVTGEAKSEGFTTITNKRRKGKKQVNNIVNKPVGVGVRLSKPKTFEYCLVVAPKHATNEVTTKPAVDIQTNNPFDALHDDDVCQGKEGESSSTGKGEGLFSSHNESNDELDSEVEETFVVETLTVNLKGASTPCNDVLNV